MEQAGKEGQSWASHSRQGGTGVWEEAGRECQGSWRKQRATGVLPPLTTPMRAIPLMTIPLPS